jgi:hypothetical protein
MSSVTTNLVLTGDDLGWTEAYRDDSRVIAAVRIDGLTIQSSVPGALRRLADRLNAIEDRADAMRSVAAAS